MLFFLLKNKSSRSGECEKRVLRNFTKFTGKHLCQSLFLNKVAGENKSDFGTGAFL